GGPETAAERGASAALAGLLFLFLAGRAGLVAGIGAGAGGLAALGALVGLGVVPGLLGLVLGQCALAVARRGLALLGQGREGDGHGHHGGHAGPDQASVHMHSSTSGVFGRRPGEAPATASAARTLYVRAPDAAMNRGPGTFLRGCKNG